MTKNIQITSTLLFFISKKLKKELNLGYINNVQTVEENIWKIKIHAKKTKELIITPEFCFISEHIFPVSEIKGFEKYLKKTLYNQRILNIYQDKNNKVICFKLDKYYLIFEFFSKSNIILTDQNFKIITSKQKEEWKDRTIKKGEIYIFPAGEDIKNKTELEISNEIKNFSEPEKIKHLSKKYNLAPIEINQMISEKKNLIKEIIKIYSLEEIGIKKIIKEDKITFIAYENKEDIFKILEREFQNIYEKKNVEVEKIKISKNEEILINQENKKKEFETKINILEKEGEFIYTNFSLIEEINKQIFFATEKKIPEKEIIQKINKYFENKNIFLKIIEINQKNKTYIIEKIEK